MSAQISTKGNSSHRLIRNLLSSLVLYESVITSQAKAKILKNEFQKILKMSGDNLKIHRGLKSKLYAGSLKKYLEQKSKFKNISLYKIGRRKGDGSEMVMVRLIIKEDNKINIPKDKK